MVTNADMALAMLRERRLIGVWPAGLTLGAPGKPTIVLTGILLDGYPEVVREVLRRIPHVVDATAEARERLERIAALVDGSP